MEDDTVTPLTSWTCDVCRQPIEKSSDGYVVWRSGPGTKDSEFRIIHQSKCDVDPRSFTSSAALDDFLGPNGLARLLSFLSFGPLKRNHSKAADQIDDIDEFVDFIRRVQTPYYEEARLRFTEEAVVDDFQDANEVYPYFPGTLEQIVKRPLPE